jgi:hypothetical protein
MIYIITPYLTDFMEVCKREGFNCPVVRGKPENQNIMQIHHPMQLMGRKIFKIDKVFYGDKVNCFDVDTLEKIKFEIELRKRDEG